ncbi:hypothetical protein C8039_15530 [Halogeometricum sp. wsp3]|nr:hypothetical protein C8039_15530 [Halogeometricum sp. wsp3]
MDRTVERIISVDVCRSTETVFDDVFVVKNSANGSDEYGYVWVTEWDSKGDAQQFYDAYVNILDAHDATKQS